MVRYLQLSDPHVCTDSRTVMNGVEPNACLARVVERVLERHDAIEFVLVTGDLVGDDLPTSYDALDRILAPIPVPIRLIPGNHDLRDPIRERLRRDPRLEMFACDPPGSAPGPVAYTFRVGAVRFLGLDSQIPGAVPGEIDPPQLRWVEDLIARDQTVPTVVFVHHPVLPIGVDWLDAHRIANGDRLLEVLSRGRVLAVHAGHVHMPTFTSARGIPCLSAPSTCYQFTDGVGRPKVITGVPGFGVFEAEGTRFGGYFEF